ncbi:MAG: aminotransferase class V-fold PLP-dependent enzyme [Turneriella sp.]
MRAGSHNTEAIISLAEALKRKLAANSYPAWQKVTGGFASLLKTAISKIAGAKIIAEDAPRAPGTLLLLLPQVPIDFLIMALDREGITVSTGTSCKSRSRSPSQALFAMGYSEAEALSVIRLSFDQNLTAADMARTADVLQQSLARLK